MPEKKTVMRGEIQFEIQIDGRRRETERKEKKGAKVVRMCFLSVCAFSPGSLSLSMSLAENVIVVV